MKKISRLALIEYVYVYVCICVCPSSWAKQTSNRHLVKMCSVLYLYYSVLLVGYTAPPTLILCVFIHLDHLTDVMITMSSIWKKLDLWDWAEHDYTLASNNRRD